MNIRSHLKQSQREHVTCKYFVYQFCNNPTVSPGESRTRWLEVLNCCKKTQTGFGAVLARRIISTYFHTVCYLLVCDWSLLDRHIRNHPWYCDTPRVHYKDVFLSYTRQRLQKKPISNKATVTLLSSICYKYLTVPLFLMYKAHFHNYKLISYHPFWGEIEFKNVFVLCPDTNRHILFSRWGQAGIHRGNSIVQNHQLTNHSRQGCRTPCGHMLSKLRRKNDTGMDTQQANSYRQSTLLHLISYT